jgi:RHS repeat-associated protein
MLEETQNNVTHNVTAGAADQALSSAGATGTRISTLNSGANITTVAVALPTPPTVLYYHADQLGSTRLLTDSAGIARGGFTFDAYGNMTTSTGSYSTPFGFSGQYRDSETGLFYLRARYYDPSTGQFLSRDPLASMTRSAYGYTQGNPLNRRDPSGLSPANDGGGEEAGAVARADEFLFRLEYAEQMQEQAALARAQALEAEAATAPFAEPPTLCRDQILGNAAGGVPGTFYGVGTAEAGAANAAGSEWVGPGSRISSDGRALVSQSGLRQYRFPQYKKNLGFTQANYEQRTSPSGPWTTNGHLDVLDPRDP